METELDIFMRSNHVSLSENHSGMETFIIGNGEGGGRG